MSYDPSLSYQKAEQLLVSTAADGNLNVAAAFAADNLASIVSAGQAAIPKASPPARDPTSPAQQALAVRQARWNRGRLTLVVSGLAGGRLHVQLNYVHRRHRTFTTRRTRIVVRTGRPTRVLLRVYSGRRRTQGPLAVRPT
jgi:hypothetical protein